MHKPLNALRDVALVGFLIGGIAVAHADQFSRADDFECDQIVGDGHNAAPRIAHFHSEHGDVFAIGGDFRPVCVDGERGRQRPWFRARVVITSSPSFEAARFHRLRARRPHSRPGASPSPSPSRPGFCRSGRARPFRGWNAPRRRSPCLPSPPSSSAGRDAGRDSRSTTTGSSR